jgi:hypothetical protein
MESEYAFEETKIEERDGARWVSGKCPACWERLAFLAPPRGLTVIAVCPNGHNLRIAQQTTAGAAPAQ